MDIQEILKAFCKQNGFDVVDDLDLSSSFVKLSTPQGKIWYRGSVENGRPTFCFGKYSELHSKSYTYAGDGTEPFDEKAFRKKRRAEKKQKAIEQERCAEFAKSYYEELLSRGLKGPHPYVERKRLPSDGLIFQANGSNNNKSLVLVGQDIFGEIKNMQFISEDGQKSFMPQGRTKGVYHFFGSEEPEFYLVGEGWATCRAAHLSQNGQHRSHAVVAFSLGQMEEAIKDLISVRHVNPRNIILLVDHDGETALRTGENPGQKTSRRLAISYRCKVWVPPLQDSDANVNLDFADLWARGDDLRFDPISWANLKDGAF